MRQVNVPSFGLTNLNIILLKPRKPLSSGGNRLKLRSAEKNGKAGLFLGWHYSEFLMPVNAFDIVHADHTFRRRNAF
jgi:hypothetical protein